MSRRPTDEGYDPIPKPKKRGLVQKVKRLIGSNGFMAIAIGLVASAIALHLAGAMPLWLFVVLGVAAIALILFGGER